MKKKDTGSPTNKDHQGIDKSPGEERGKGEKVTREDLKGKKTDGDPSNKKDQPLKPGKNGL